MIFQELEESALAMNIWHIITTLRKRLAIQPRFNSDLYLLDFQEAQDNRDEIAYFKRQVKSLTDQIQQQQQKITELRYRSTSPGPVPLGTVRLTRYSLWWILRKSPNCGMRFNFCTVTIPTLLLPTRFILQAGDMNYKSCIETSYM